MKYTVCPICGANLDHGEKCEECNPCNKISEREFCEPGTPVCSLAIKNAEKRVESKSI